MRSNNARRNTRLYDNEAASPKLMPVYYEASRPRNRSRHISTGCPPAYDMTSANENSNPRGGSWSRCGVYYHPDRQFSRSPLDRIWVKFDRPTRCPFADLSRSSETRELARLPDVYIRCSHIFPLFLLFLLIMR